MTSSSQVTGLRFKVSSAQARDGGLLGYLSFELGSVRIDGVALRKTRAGRLELSYPERERRGGRRFPIVRPVSLQARRQLEAEVLAALRALYGIASDGEVSR